MASLAAEGLLITTGTAVAPGTLGSLQGISIIAADLVLLLVIAWRYPQPSIAGSWLGHPSRVSA